MTEKKRFLLISPKNRTVYNFRGDLIKEIQNRGYEVIVTGPDRDNIERVEALGVRFVEIPMNKTGTSIKGDLNYMNSLYSLMEKEQPDAVLGYTIKPVIYGAMAAKKAGIKNVNGLITGGGYTFTAKTLKAKMLGFIVRTLYRRAFKYMDNAIFQNKDDRDEFIAMGLVKSEKCHVVNGSGVNMQHFVPTDYPTKTTFFMLSRLLYSKGVFEYLEAARLVKKDHPEVEFLLLGKYENSMQDAIPKEIIQKYEKDSIITRYDETDDVRQYYSKASVYVLPSYREGTPRTVLEAMAMARPVITTDINGCRETVKDGDTGFLVPIKDSNAVADAMKRFIDSSELIKSMGEASLKYCEEKFEVGEVNAELLEIIKV